MRPLTGRDVARLAGRGSEAGIRKALARLTSHGIIRAEEAGRALLHTLNRDHLAVPALEVLGVRELRRLRRERPPIVEDLHNEALTLVGRDVRHVFGGRQ